MQGRHLRADSDAQPGGFIPAGAGATIGGLYIAWPSRVHPCGCRGDAFAAGVDCAPPGSSLRVQGRRRRAARAARPGGFIPAGAGATPSDQRPPPAGRVHPCGCRGDSGGEELGAYEAGSSLRVQGRRWGEGGESWVVGFIPAGAGATRWRNWCMRTARVHPCGCRGDLGQAQQALQDLGSSLRVQGRPDRIRRAPLGVGFIPAGAGATGSRPFPASRPGVHPCGCRGDADTSRPARCCQGSSLRVQGRQLARAGRAGPPRFIPAGAGATRRRRSRSARSWVHPCGCRGDVLTAGAELYPHGSSLRVQGRRRRYRSAAGGRGFIPAGAGATARR